MESRYFLPNEIWALILTHAIYEVCDKINLTTISKVNLVCKLWRGLIKPNCEKIQKDFLARHTQAAETLSLMKSSHREWTSEQESFTNQVKRLIHLHNNKVSKNELENIENYQTITVSFRSQFISLNLKLLISILEKKFGEEPKEETQEEMNLRNIIACYPELEQNLMNKLFNNKKLNQEEISKIYRRSFHEIEVAHFYCITKSQENIKQKISLIKKDGTALTTLKRERKEKAEILEELKQVRAKLFLACTSQDVNNFDQQQFIPACENQKELKEKIDNATQQLANKRQDLIRSTRDDIDFQTKWNLISLRFYSIFGDPQEMQKNVNEVLKNEGKVASYK